MTKVQRVKLEHGETFQQVVKDYAIQGQSRKYTAKLLDMNLSYFRRLCDAYNLHQYFKPQLDMNEHCKGGGGMNTKSIHSGA